MEGWERKAIVKFGWYFWAVNLVGWLSSGLTFGEVFRYSAIGLGGLVLLFHAGFVISDLVQPGKVEARNRQEFEDWLAINKGRRERYAKALNDFDKALGLKERNESVEANKEEGAQ